MVEYLVVEFGKGKFEEFLFSDSASPKARQQYRKVFSRLSNLFEDFFQSDMHHCL